MTLGAIPIGASAVANASKADDQPSNENLSRANDKSLVELDEVRGKKRGQLLQSANTSEKVDFVTDQLAGPDDVTSVYQFTLRSGTTGFGVTYGEADRAEGRTIRYYQSELYADGTVAAGGKPVGDGIVGVRFDGTSKTISHVHGTPRQKAAMSVMQDNDEYNAFKRALDGATLVEDETIIVRDLSGKAGQTSIFIPIENGEEITNRLVLTGPTWPSQSTVQKYSIVASPGDQGAVEAMLSPQCVAICTALTGVGLFGCAGACGVIPVTAPIAPYCGQICAAVAVGTCGSTCTDLLG